MKCHYVARHKRELTLINCFEGETQSQAAVQDVSFSENDYTKKNVKGIKLNYIMTAALTYKNAQTRVGRTTRTIQHSSQKTAYSRITM